MRRTLPGAALGAALLTATLPASANGRFPASNQIVFSPPNPSWIVVRSTFGIIITKDAAATWRWLCEDTLGLPPTSNEDPYLGLSQNGSLVAGLSLGLEVSPNTGCDWTVVGGPLKGQLIKDLVVHTDNLHDVDMITSTFGASLNVDGGVGYAQQPYATTDDGMTWAAFGKPIDPTAIVTTIDVAPSDPNRIYVSAFRGDGATRTASLFVSSDRGMTWTEHQAPLNANTETAIYIGAVDPTHEDVLYLRTEGQSRLVVTTNAGQTFNAVKTLDDEMLGLTLSSDGSKIYIGSVADGLMVAATTSLSFTQTSSIHVQCLATRGTELWACSDEVSGFVAGVSQDDGKTFTPKLHLLQIEAPIACAAGATAELCSGGPFNQLCSNLGACYAGSEPEPLIDTCQCGGICDGGMYSPTATCPEASARAEAGTEAGAGHGSASSRSSCGCSVVGAGGTFGALATGGALAVGLRLRRRRRNA